MAVGTAGPSDAPLAASPRPKDHLTVARVLITAQIPGDGPARLAAAGHDVSYRDVAAPMPRDELLGAVEGVDALVAMLVDRVDAELLDAAGPGLRVVADVVVGYDNVDVGACTERGVVVTNTPGVLTDATADIAMALVLMTTRGLGAAERRVRTGEPWPWSFTADLGTGLRGRTLGIVGPGAIGLATARRATAFGMEILLSGRSTPDPGVVEGLGARVVDLGELLAASDVVSLHCPLTPATHHLIGADELRAMKSTAHLVNTARGPVVDEPALVAALEAGEIAGAGLDVFEDEPRVHAGLLGRADVVLLPHVGSATVETRTAMADLAIANVLAVLGGEDAVTPVPG
jgi:glyoxylate reductase